MDPKNTGAATPTNLDPKLKEMYDRIMAVNVSASTSGPAQNNQAVTAENSVSTPPVIPPPIAQQPAANAAFNIPQNTTPNIPITTMPTTPAQPLAQPAKTATVKAPTSFVATSKKGGSSKLKSVLYVFGGILFLLVYTFFWLKYFKIAIPFLPF